MTAAKAAEPAPAATAMIDEAADAVRARLGARAPAVAIVLGSGLGQFAERLSDAVRIPYADIPHFPAPTVIGHSGELVAGALEGRPVLVQSGRFHMYEGHPAALTALPVRVFARLGVGTVILTNAAGGIRRGFGSGTVMLIADQINLSFRNALFGPSLPGEIRFPDMSDAYDPGLRAIAREVARRRKIALAEGVYVGLLGPSYETPAEIRMLERLGADAVGMSTVLEVVAARAAGLRCLGFSAITNPAAGTTLNKLNHLEVMEVAYRIAGELAALIEGVVAEL
ncbi:MAG TPA: purine-nucleoside phosphorylase [Gemmatimonadales bacterium]|nr:purine-nucleoside phosphorylase [Gemmatimonadales bacterium]